MIFRTYERERGFADGVSDSSSQDVYDFTFKSDPYDFNSSQESGQLAFLPPRKGGGDCGKKSNKLRMIEVDSKYHGTDSSQQESNKFGDLRISDGVSQKPKKLKKVSIDPYDYNSSQESEEFAFLPKSKGSGLALLPQRKGDGDSDGGFRKPKKSKMVEVDSKPYSINSSQESKQFGSLRISGWEKPKKLKNVSIDHYDYNSSKELEKIAILPQRKGREDCVFDFTEDEDLWESKNSKVVDVDSYVFNSSQELAISQSRNSGSHGDYFNFDEGSGKSKKKDRGEINPDSCDYNSSQNLEEYAVLRQSKARENRVFDFSEDDDLWESKKSKNSNSDLHAINSSQELGNLDISQSRKRNGDYWDCGDGFGSSKKNDRSENGVLQKKKKKKKKTKSRELEQGYVELTATLMETQESGEMMEHEDEVNFALDGLKKGQPVRIRRASLLSLLSVCGTLQQRRYLKIHGMAKTIIDAVLGLSFDDMPSNLAAAALIYILTIDGQDDYLLDSPSCIRFLIKLLKPISPGIVKEKALPIGSKLLSLCKNVGFLQESAKGTDSSSNEITLKVREILVNCKEIKARDDTDGGTEEPELNPKWISLLTMEKACSSSISVEDTSGIRKTGGKFKEKLREFGALDAVFEVARKCHSVMEKWFEKNPTFALDSREILGLESLVLLLKCLKIMENALFLSNDNQRHLLGAKGNFDGQGAPRTFTKLVLSVIKILSGVSLLRSSLTSSQDEKTGCVSYAVEMTSQGSCGLGIKSSVGTAHDSSDALLLNIRAESSQASGTTRNSDSVFHRSDDSETDPFSFDDNVIETSKWDILTGSSQKSLSQGSRAAGDGQYRYDSRFEPLESQQESNNVECHQTQEASCSSAGDEDKSNLLSDCLLTAVKVLMNLTNDNPEGCRQIATCGGLEILSSLIAGHFSSFSSSMPHADKARDSSSSSKSSPRTNTPLTDRELDFLVALLGLLVNLVEKDGRNRSRLAAATVSLPNLDSEDQSDVISLLCSIFLANTNGAAGEETFLSLEDENSILQGEKEAEKMIVEAYTALLLAFLSTESQNVRNAISECLPDRNLKTLVPVLERFLEFHTTLNMIPPETHTAVLEVIESCRIP